MCNGKKQQGNVTRYLSVSDVPDFEKGESDVLFVTKNNSVICPLVSCSKGRYRDLNGLVTSENGLPLLLTSNQTFELGHESMIEQIGITNRKQGFSKGISNATGESTPQFERGTSILDTASFVADLKSRAYEIKTAGKIKGTTFISSNMKADFSTPFFKEAVPKNTLEPKQQIPVETNRAKSDFDLWEEQTLKNNGGDPVVKKPTKKQLELIKNKTNLNARTR